MTKVVSLTWGGLLVYAIGQFFALRHILFWESRTTVLPSVSLFASNEPKPVEPKFDDHQFENILWPTLQRKLCPAGIPEHSLGPKLFELGRAEYGTNLLITKNVKKIYNGFYHNYNVLIQDGNHPETSLMYIPVWKAGNNQIRSYLQSHFNQKPIAEKELEFNSTRKDGLILNDKSAKYSYTEPKNAVRYQHRKHKPCIFTVIRDPISHFLSGYNEVEFRLSTEKIFERVQEIDPPSYTKIPFGKGNLLLEEDHLEMLAGIRFEAFVRDLLVGDPGMVTAHYIVRHVYPMSMILKPLQQKGLLPTNRWEHWILSSTDNLTETLPRFLAQRCPSFAENYPWAQNATKTSSGLPPMESTGQHTSSNDPLGAYKAAKDVWKKGGKAARALCHIHAFDYACFYGNSVPTRLRASEIPALCKEVYSSPSFTTAILGH